MPVEILWINGALGVGKSHTAGELHYRMHNSTIFDPELIGYGIQKSIGKKFAEDFQDFQSYRSGVIEGLIYLSQKITGTIIVPMTLYNHRYFHEIIDGLRDADLIVRHIVLLAQTATIEDRLCRRNFGVFRYLMPKTKLPASEDFALGKMNEITSALKGFSEDLVIHTDNMTLTEVVECIAEYCNYNLVKDQRVRLQFLRKLLYTIRNIRR